jgi:hypothetical protein
MKLKYKLYKRQSSKKYQLKIWFPDGSFNTDFRAGLTVKFI